MTKIEAEETNTDNVLMRHPTRLLLWIFAVSVIVGIVCLREVADSPSLRSSIALQGWCQPPPTCNEVGACNPCQ